MINSYDPNVCQSIKNVTLRNFLSSVQKSLVANTQKISTCSIHLYQQELADYQSAQIMLTHFLPVMAQEPMSFAYIDCIITVIYLHHCKEEVFKYFILETSNQI